MCGILGFVCVRGAELPAREAFERALNTLAHRGPDDDGIWGDRRALFGHRRLSIIDLSAAGHQPMVSADGRYVIVFNGEIYNFHELRRALEADGVVFRSHSDTEVLLELFAREGPASVSRLRGMFAFAIWDTQEEELFLVRDRLGIKPIYVWKHGRGLAFASELRTLRSLPGGPSELSAQAVLAYISWGHVPSPLTMLDGVSSLPPATWLRFNKQGLEQGTYWSIPHEPPIYRTREAAVEALRPALQEAVRLRCVSDVPMGAFLSGGVDSSAIVALMRAAGQPDIRTFSVTFPGTDLDETSFAEQVAQRFETHHTAAPATEAIVLGTLDDFFAAVDQPTCDGLNTYLVSRLAKAAGLTVALSGIGGDELFGGYPTFDRARVAQAWLRHVPQAARSVAAFAASRARAGLAKLEAFELDGNVLAQSYFMSRGLFAPRQAKRLLLNGLSPRADLLAGLLPEDPASDSWFHATMELELRRYMHDQLLKDTDVFGMANAVEIRVPLIDHKIVEIVARTHPEVVREGNHKALLRDALPAPLPSEIVRRPKMGFTFPFELWLRTKWSAKVEDVLREPSGLLDADAIERIWQGYLNRQVHWSRPWALYVLLRWAKQNGLSH